MANKNPTKCKLRKQLEQNGLDFNIPYRALSFEDKLRLGKARSVARFKQPASAKSRGQSQTEAYYLSLQKAKCRTGLGGILAGIFGSSKKSAKDPQLTLFGASRWRK
jgi:hypothetical protein